MSDTHSGQNFANHSRVVAPYHFIAGPILLLNAVYGFYSVITLGSLHSIMNALVAVALIIVFLFARLFALGAQDRVIRLEMRLRMKELLPADMQSRLTDFTPSQMVALRFASDAELPALARKVLDDNMTNSTSIKKEIEDWQGDYYRV